MRWMLAILLFAARLCLAQTAPPAAAVSSAAPAARPSAIDAARDDLAHGKPTEAIALLEKIRVAGPEQTGPKQTGPEQKGVAHELGLAYYRTGKLLQARDAFAQAIQADPSDVESVQMEGLSLYRMGQPAAAIPYLKRVTHWTPNANADANHVLGLCYLNSQHFDEARQAFAEEYELKPDSGAAYLLLARMLVQVNLPEQGAAAAERALALSPGLPLAHFLVGEEALFKSDVARATTEFEAERALNPEYAPVYERLADVDTRTGKYDQAEELLLKSIALDNSRTGPFLLMGKVLLRRDDPETAAMYLQHAEKMDPSNFILHTLLGQTYRGLGHEEQARTEFDAAAKIHAAGELKLQNVQ
jgi:tetratricopeptide (TPR) repeat protein